MLAADRFVQPPLVPLQESKMSSVPATLGQDAGLVCLRIPPHLANGLSFDNQEESNSTTVMADIERTRNIQDYLWVFALLRVVAPNIVVATRIIPIVWTKRSRPTERFAAVFGIGYVFGVLTI
jgi:hypothetical protein